MSIREKLTRGEISEAVRELTANACQNTPRNADYNDLAYTIAYIDGLNDLADKLIDIIEEVKE